MKIAEINGCQIHILPSDHTMVIVEPDAIFFRCTLCGEIKSVHMLVGSTEKDIPWLRLCFCAQAQSNAPHTGGDTQPLPAGEALDEVKQTGAALSMELAQTLLTNPIPFRARLIERDIERDED